MKNLYRLLKIIWRRRSSTRYDKDKKAGDSMRTQNEIINPKNKGKENE